MSAPTRRRRGFGSVRKLPSGRYQAAYSGPDGTRHLAPVTFQTIRDADAWLSGINTDIARQEWHRPAPQAAIDGFSSYAEAWVTSRELKPRTRSEYRKIITGHLIPEFGTMRLDDITPVRVRDWHARLATATGATRRAHCYALLRTILNTAVADDVIASNPCRVRGAGQSRRAREIHQATPPELATIVAGMRPEYRGAVLLAAWCGLRFGEIAELRRSDIDLKAGTVRVARAVVHVDGAGFIVGDPKSGASKRTVTIPSSVMPAIREHLAEHVPARRDALLFPAPDGGPLRADGALHRDFHAARIQAGRPDLRFHDLRHTGASMATQAGATLAEVMHRLGHSTAAAAMRYQHSTAARDTVIAEALSQAFDQSGDVIPLRARRAGSLPPPERNCAPNTCASPNSYGAPGASPNAPAPLNRWSRATSTP